MGLQTKYGPDVLCHCCQQNDNQLPPVNAFRIIYLHQLSLNTALSCWLWEGWWLWVCYDLCMHACCLLLLQVASLVGIVVDMLQHVVTTCHLLPISGQHGWHANLVTEWVAGVTCHELSCVIYNTTRWHSLSSVFVTCCEVTKKDVDVMSHPSWWRHVTKCHMLLTMSPSILLRRQTTIPTKVASLTFVIGYFVFEVFLTGWYHVHGQEHPLHLNLLANWHLSPWKWWCQK